MFSLQDEHPFKATALANVPELCPQFVGPKKPQRTSADAGAGHCGGCWLNLFKWNMLKVGRTRAEDLLKSVSGVFNKDEKNMLFTVFF